MFIYGIEPYVLEIFYYGALRHIFVSLFGLAWVSLFLMRQMLSFVLFTSVNELSWNGNMLLVHDNKNGGRKVFLSHLLTENNLSKPCSLYPSPTPPDKKCSKLPIICVKNYAFWHFFSPCFFTFGLMAYQFREITLKACQSLCYVMWDVLYLYYSSMTCTSCFGI